MCVDCVLVVMCLIGPGDVTTHSGDPRSRNVVSLKTEMSHKRGSILSQYMRIDACCRVGGGRVMTSRAEMGTQSSIDEVCV